MLMKKFHIRLSTEAIQYVTSYHQRDASILEKLGIWCETFQTILAQLHRIFYNSVSQTVFRDLFQSVPPNNKHDASFNSFRHIFVLITS